MKEYNIYFSFFHFLCWGHSYYLREWKPSVFCIGFTSKNYPFLGTLNTPLLLPLFVFLLSTFANLGHNFNKL